MNSFKGAVLTFPNRTIHFVLAEIMKFRVQLTKRLNNEWKSLSGYNDAMNRFMVTELEKLADSLENITYNPHEASQEDLELTASDTTRSLAADYDERAITEDNLLGPVLVDRELPWDLSGTDLDIPQINPENCPNDVARSFITGLDDFFVQMTRLDSRHEPKMITKYESRVMRDMLVSLYTICDRKGGEVNRSDTPSGVLQKHEANTFQG